MENDTSKRYAKRPSAQLLKQTAAIRAEQEYFASRASKANPEDLADILRRAGTQPPRDGDEIPEGWLNGPGDEGL